MPNTPRFTEAHAHSLVRLLGAPERPQGGLNYQETAGFLFAVACVPELIAPDEWLPVLFNEEDPNFKDQNEAAECVGALIALYDFILAGIEQGDPQLPPLCAPLPQPMANFAPAPLGQWSSGFSAGYEWLEDEWPEELSQEADEYLGYALVTLTFFDSHNLARTYIEAAGGDVNELEQWATEVLEVFPEVMSGYADLAAEEMADFDAEEDELPVQEPIRVEQTPGRNDPCPCGSGMKYMKCCGKE